MDQSEFDEALASKVAPSDEETAIKTTDTETPAEETVAEAVEPEDNLEVVEEEEDDTPEVVSEPQYGDEVQSFLSKYNGDIGKALEAAVHAQAKLGEQGQELGELRRMVEEVRDRPAPTVPTSPFVDERLQTAIDENPAQVAQWALQNENAHVYEAALSEWYDQDPKAATRFEITLNRELAKQEAQAAIAPEIESVRERDKQRVMVDAHRALSQKYPDFQQVLETATADEVAGIDRNLLATAMSENPMAAQELVYRWVKSERGQREAQQAAQQQEAVRQEKLGAAVVTTGAAVSTPEKTTLEKLADYMLAPDPHSVSHGLER